MPTGGLIGMPEGWRLKTGAAGNAVCTAAAAAGTAVVAAAAGCAVVVVVAAAAAAVGFAVARLMPGAALVLAGGLK